MLPDTYITIFMFCMLNCMLASVLSIESTESFPEETSALSPPLWNTIEGKIIYADKKPTSEWISSTHVIVNGGEHVGFLKEDGSFVVTGLSAGSYIVEVINPNMNYDSARIDITSKGKLRARKVNHIQPNLVTHMPYPLRLNYLGNYRYFQPREQWRITDVLMSPMVLMMVLPLILILILPKMMSDPETRREMEQVSLPKYEMPEMSEYLTSLFGGAKDSDHDKKGQKSIKSKKNN